MNKKIIGKVSKITGGKVLVLVTQNKNVGTVNIDDFITGYVSIGSLIGTHLVDGRSLVLMVDEIYDNCNEVYITASISGVYDEVIEQFGFGTNAYPLVGEDVFRIGESELNHIFGTGIDNQATIGTYVYNPNVEVGYDPNILFGKHLGVFGNTGSGKTCTVVSIIQNYIRNNQKKDIKFIILDVNGEYKNAFNENEMEYIPFEDLRFNHSILSNSEYGRLFRAAEGIQYPALKACISQLTDEDEKWDLKNLPNKIEAWIKSNATSDKSGKKELFSINQLTSMLRSMRLRIEGILEEKELMMVINSPCDEDTLDRILYSSKKVIVLDLQVSMDALDIVVYLLFKAIYEYRSKYREGTHLNLILEEAHRYINSNTEESKLGSYYIDKLSREGRKFGVGLVIASQVPSMLQYEVVSQCNSVVMHKITSRRDMDFLRNILRVSNDTFYLQMSALEKQTAIVCGEAFPNDTVVRIHDASPLPRSNDPEITDVSFEEGALNTNLEK